MLRRNLLQAALVAPGFLAPGTLWAMPRIDTRLLVVFLRGGYDAANVVIPTGSDLYYQARPTIAIARPDPGDPAASLPLDADWSLHPALRDSIYPLWRARQAAFVPFVGARDTSRSHFQTQDSIELGQPVGAASSYRSGFMARLASKLGGVQPIAFTQRLPLAFEGTPQIPNIELSRTSQLYGADHQAKLIQEMFVGDALEASVLRSFSLREQVAEARRDEMMWADRAAISTNGFERSARQIGRLMQSEFNLGFVDVGGWDTHVNQGSHGGFLASRLEALGRGLAGFVEEIGASAWEKTVVIVLSEFGRTVRENGDRGTDHGRGGAYWVLGGGLTGGRLAGEQVKLTEAALDEGRDLPVLTDCFSFLGGLLSRVYGLPPSAIGDIFPGSRPLDLSLV